jgi:adenylosuccinate synthase
MLFASNGVHCVVDGQFGSTGKGALCAWLAEKALMDDKYFRGAIYSGGPNSGHTFYHHGEKHVLKQLPTFAVATTLLGGECAAYLSAGAVVDPYILVTEAQRYPDVKIYVHPNAAVIGVEHKQTEQSGSIAAVASTQSGTGAAIAMKVMREPRAIARDNLFAMAKMPPNIAILNHELHPDAYAYFMEVSQGFSLGINSEFYPHVTSRECTVMQGLADARIPASQLAKTYMAVRTFPIRVGNTAEGHSGDWYQDQDEISWEDLGVEPELTTVTKRVRRVATFSNHQFDDALAANDPDYVFVNFLNYIKGWENQNAFLNNIQQRTRAWLICGYGPDTGSIHLARRPPDFAEFA